MASAGKQRALPTCNRKQQPNSSIIFNPQVLRIFKIYKNIFVYSFFWTRKPFPQKGASRLQLLPVAYLLCLLLLSSSIFTIFTSSLGHPPITSEVMAGIKLRSLCHERSSKERKVHGPTGLRSDWSPVGIRAPKSSRVVTPESSEHVLLMLLVS